jgi:hypothetical protein
MTLEILSRCTCSTFSVYPKHPLYLCIMDCPESEQVIYLRGFSDTTYDCQDLGPFGNIPHVTAMGTAAATATSGGTSGPTSSPDVGDDDDDDQGTTTSGGGGGGDPVQPNGAGEASNRAQVAANLLAAGGLVVALLF